MASDARSGWSAVELLVVAAILGILLAVALPAVQHARESARKTRCRNNLRQIGTALQDHHSQFGHLPVDATNGYGIAAFLLPHLDQSALYERLSPLTVPLSDTSGAQDGLRGTVLEVFRCPSDPKSAETPGGSNYLGNWEIFAQRTELTDVLDGESNTIAAGETLRAQAWALPGLGSCADPPNSGGDFASAHSGGAHFVMCDGAVRFIIDAIDAALFRALGTPAGGEPVGSF